MGKIVSKNKKFIAVTVILVILICLAAAEAGIRVYHLTCDRQRFVWLPDRFLGYVHSSNNRFKHHYTEGTRVIVAHRTNTFGLLGEDIRQKKGKGTFRILVLGDSFTEAIQVPDDQNFCGRLQSLLNGLPGKPYEKIEVLNAGVSGYSPLSYYLTYTRELSRLEPDLILVQLFANDVFEDNEATAKSLLDEEGLPLQTHRYFTEQYWQHPPVARKDFNGRPAGYRVMKFLIDHSRLIEYFYVKLYNTQKASAFHQKMIRQDQFGTGYQFFILDPQHVLSQNEAFRAKAWGTTQKYLLALRDEAQRRQSQLVLFYIPIEAQLVLDRYGEHVSLYIQKQMGTYFDDLLSSFAWEHNIRFLDLLNDFESHKNEVLYLNRDGHLTAAGHRVAARALFQYILQSGLVK